MKYAWPFFKYHFIWAVKPLSVVLGLDLLFLIAISWDGVMEEKFLWGILYMNLLLPFLNLANAVYLKNQTDYQPSFSFKYFLSLPIKAPYIISSLMVANLISLIPFTFIFIWIFGEQQMIAFEAKSFLKHFLNYPLQTYFLAILAVEVLTLIGIRNNIESPRKSYNKGMLPQILLLLKKFIFFIPVANITITLVIYSVFKRTSFFVPLIFLVLIILFLFWRTLLSFQKEEISYWIWKRDIIPVLVLPAIFFILVLSGYLKPIASEARLVLLKWRNSPKLFYSTGFDAFRDQKNFTLKNIESLLQSEGKDVNNAYGFTPLMVSALMGEKKIEVSEYLKKQKVPLKSLEGADSHLCKEAVYCKGNNIYHLAILGKNQKFLELYREYDYLAFDKNVKGVTPLHLAAEKCLLFEISLEKRDINIKNDLGQTPLHSAVNSFCWPWMVKLLQGGASLVIQDKKQKSPWDYLEESRWKRGRDFVDFLSSQRIPASQRQK